VSKQTNQERLHQLLCAYILDEVSAEERAALERALEGSSELRAERERLVATIGLVKSSLPQADALSERATAELVAAANRKNPRSTGARSGRAWFGRPAFRIAASLLVVGGLWAAYKATSPDMTPAARSDELVAKAPAEAAGAPADLEPSEGGGLRAKFDPGNAPENQDAPAEDALGTLLPTGLQDGAHASEPAVEQLYDERIAGKRQELERQIENFAKGAKDAERLARSQTGSANEAIVGAVVGQAAEPEAKLGVPSQESRAESVDEQARYSPSRTSKEGMLFAGGSGGGAPAAAAPPASKAGPSSPGLYEARSSAPTSPAPAGRNALAARESRAEVTGKDFNAEGEAGLAFRMHALGYLDVDDEGDQRVDRWLQSCRVLPGEKPRDMFFRFWGDNPFETTALDRLSTFSVDVDTASYALARRYLVDGHLPERAQVRTEEFLNYFGPDLPAPTESTFAIHTELAPSLFSNRFSTGGDAWMLRVGIRGKEVSREERQPLALTFVVDVSGSMQQESRLELVKHAMRLLLSELDARDAISIVAFSNEARLILPMTSAASRDLIEVAVHQLSPGGGTNAEAGLRMGYEQALAALTHGVHNRVVLLSDGVANIGETDQNRLDADVERHRKSGIYLNTIGVGMGNHNDVFLEQLADKGDGICNYVDDAKEARRALVENFTGAFEPIARDVKVQVDFDPAQVQSYRLLGYENRLVADADFRNDAVDAGEVGAGHQVVALYELVRTGAAADGPLAKVHLRWKAPYTDGVARPGGDEVTEISKAVSAGSAASSFEATGPGYRRSILVAQFAEFLRRSFHARDDSLDRLIEETRKLSSELKDADTAEFLSLVETSKALLLARRAQVTAVDRALDEYRHHCYWAERLRLHRFDSEQATYEELQRKIRDLETKLRKLIGDQHADAR
jgi:Ca-activated chloride channel family protein